jgi:hypothetical protein
MPGHWLVITVKGEDWGVEHEDGCAITESGYSDPVFGAITTYDCLVGRVVDAMGIDDHLEWRDLEPGRYEIKDWEWRGNGFYSPYEEYEAGIEFVDTDDRGSAP